jgi:hypothetical protein
MKSLRISFDVTTNDAKEMAGSVESSSGQGNSVQSMAWAGFITWEMGRIDRIEMLYVFHTWAEGMSGRGPNKRRFRSRSV